MLNVKKMTFEEFIKFGEEKTGSKVDGKLKAILRIVFDNFKCGACTEDDLRRMTDAMKNSRKAS